MNIVTLDFESFYSDDFQLKTTTTEGYIRDKRFEVHGCAVRTPDGKFDWVGGMAFHNIYWRDLLNDSIVLCHHAQFDGLILSHVYGIKPRGWLCTMSMARLLIGNHLGVGLDSLAKHFGLAAKTIPYNLFKNKHWHELDYATQNLVATGARHDVELTWQLFNILAKDFPTEEYAVVDTTIRMFTEPVLHADTELLAKVWEDEERNKSARLKNLGLIDDTELQSADKFKALLEAEGVEIEYKDGKNGPIPCFAKNDEFMERLLEDEDPIVRALAEARVGAKSTLLQTRAENWGWMATRGPLCVYLRYAAAHTSRWGGGDKSNFQNPPPELNAAIMAPEGYYIAAPDSAQVECRILNYLAGQEDKIEEFRQGKDPYVKNAEAFCGHPVTKESHPELRQAGKVVELQAGFMSGAAKIRTSLRVKAKILVSLDEAEHWKQAYRQTHPMVEQYWKTAGKMISRLAGGPSIEWGPMQIRDGKIYLPNGIPLDYTTLEFHRPGAEEEITNPYDRDGYWRIRSRRGWTKMHAGVLTENVVQALERVVVSQVMLRIRRAGYRIVGMKHDDLWILIPKDGREQQHLEFCKHEMRREVPWLPGCPLDAESYMGERYSDVKG